MGISAGPAPLSTRLSPTDELERKRLALIRAMEFVLTPKTLHRFDDKNLPELIRTHVGLQWNVTGGLAKSEKRWSDFESTQQNSVFFNAPALTDGAKESAHQPFHIQAETMHETREGSLIIVGPKTNGKETFLAKWDDLSHRMGIRLKRKTEPFFSLAIRPSSRPVDPWSEAVTTLTVNRWTDFHWSNLKAEAATAELTQAKKALEQWHEEGHDLIPFHASDKGFQKFAESLSTGHLRKKIGLKAAAMAGADLRPRHEGSWAHIQPQEYQQRIRASIDKDLEWSPLKALKDTHHQEYQEFSLSHELERLKEPSRRIDEALRLLGGLCIAQPMMKARAQWRQAHDGLGEASPLQIGLLTHHLFSTAFLEYQEKALDWAQSLWMSWPSQTTHHSAALTAEEWTRQWPEKANWLKQQLKQLELDEQVESGMGYTPFAAVNSSLGRAQKEFLDTWRLTLNALDEEQALDHTFIVTPDVLLNTLQKIERRLDPLSEHHPSLRSESDFKKEAPFTSDPCVLKAFNSQESKDLDASNPLLHWVSPQMEPSHRMGTEISTDLVERTQIRRAQPKPLAGHTIAKEEPKSPQNPTLDAQPDGTDAPKRLRRHT